MLGREDGIDVPETSRFVPRVQIFMGGGLMVSDLRVN